MDIGDIPLFSMLRSRLGYLSERQKLIAQNVANSETPGYAPRDLKPWPRATGGHWLSPGLISPATVNDTGLASEASDTTGCGHGVSPQSENMAGSALGGLAFFGVLVMASD